MTETYIEGIDNSDVVCRKLRWRNLEMTLDGRIKGTQKIVLL